MRACPRPPKSLLLCWREYIMAKARKETMTKKEFIDFLKDQKKKNEAK